MPSEADSKPNASSEASNAVSDPAPASSSEPTNGEAAPVNSTSDANQAAVALDNPALPPASPSDNTRAAGKESDLDMKATNTVEGAVSGEAVVAPEGDDAGASAKKGSHKRRSSAGVPEHKGRKLNKKKSTITLHLNAKPGDYYWARMKSYPPWPAIVCDEEMLPESLLQNRPVTAMRPDGSYREDFLEGGKNVRDRTYPVMYLATNEFSWMPNIDLKPLDFEEVDNAQQGKKTKQLWAAYELARERHGLQHFKDLLAEHEEAMREEMAEIERLEAEKAEKADKAEKSEKKTKRKSKAAEEVVDEDVAMEDGDVEEEADGSAKKAKASKKRKKDVESDGETAKPAKTPKTKLKVNLTKSADGESATKSKGKGKAAKAKESPKPPQLTEAEKRQKREKEVLYFRHKLQKGFLSTDSTPKESEMQTMAEYFTSLEAHEELEHSIIRNTKIHKVLKAIVKLSAIPKDEEFHFKQRSIDLLQKWQKILAENAEAGEGAGDATEVGESRTNGEETKDAEAKDDTAESTEAPVEAAEETENGAEDEADGGAKMSDTKDEASPAVQNGLEATKDGSAEAEAMA